jgi:hypothetical protein
VRLHANQSCLPAHQLHQTPGTPVPSYTPEPGSIHTGFSSDLPTPTPIQVPKTHISSCQSFCGHKIPWTLKPLNSYPHLEEHSTVDMRAPPQKKCTNPPTQTRGGRCFNFGTHRNRFIIHKTPPPSCITPTPICCPTSIT